jgi:hypothetical protein
MYLGLHINEAFQRNKRMPKTSYPSLGLFLRHNSVILISSQVCVQMLTIIVIPSGIFRWGDFSSERRPCGISAGQSSTDAGCSPNISVFSFHHCPHSPL